MASSNSRLGLKIGLAVLAIAVAGYFFVFASRPLAKVAKVTEGTAYDAVPGSVVVRAEYAMQLKSESGGRVLKSALDEGKVVKEGDFLVQLDPTDLELQIERIDNDLKAAQARLKVGSLSAIELEGARADLVNAERQFKLGSISETDLQRAQRAVTQLEKKVELENVANKQAVDTLDNALRTTQRQHDKARIVALFDGKISEVFARKGDLIGGGSPIATIISTSRTVEAKIAEENFSGIRPGQRATVRFLGYGNQQYDAKVVKVLPTADPETQRYIVHLEVQIDPDLLVPGITGEVNIIVNERKSQAIIPRRALFQRSVFVVKDNRVEQRKVDVGFTSLNQVEITKGLNTGEFVIVEDLDRFRPGDRVRTKLTE
jgi:RND family efflux transporter MFP subunit